MIEIEDRFVVPAAPAEVMRRFSDVERIAQCLPGVALEGRDQEGYYLGTMTVAFGPKRVKFQGRVRCDFDLDGRRGTLAGAGSAAGRAATIRSHTAFSIHPHPDAGPDANASVVEVLSRTELHGVLAQFAAAGGAVLGRQIMRDFSERLAEELRTESGGRSRQSQAEAPHTALPGPSSSLAPDPQPLSALSLVWRVLRSLLGKTRREWRA